MKTKVLHYIILPMILTPLFAVTGCGGNAPADNPDSSQADMATLEKEIEIRIRQYENYLVIGDSVGLGNMYMEDAEIIPSISGRENIVKIIGGMIRDSIVGNFETTNLWGNNDILVEEGKGVWSYKNGQIASSGKYLLVWTKDAGEWKILRDTWFPDKKK